MKLYMVAKMAVYRHEVFGIFSSMELANECAKRGLGEERDSHHDFEIVEYDLDVYGGETEKQVGVWSQRFPDDSRKSKGPVFYEATPTTVETYGRAPGGG